MQPDGTLIIDTHLDADGIKKGAAGVSKAIERAKGSLGSLSAAMQKAFGGGSSKTLQLENSIKLTESKISALKDELFSLATVEVKSKAFEKLTSNIENAKAELAQLYAQADAIGDQKMADFESTGLPTDNGALDASIEQDAAWKKVQSLITATEAKLDSYKSKFDSVMNNGGVTPGAETKAYADKSRKLEELTGKLEVYKQKLNEASNAQTASGKSASAMGTKLSRAGKSATKSAGQMNIFQKSLKRIKQALMGMVVYKAVRAVLDSVKVGMQNLAAASPEVNAGLSSVKSSLTRLKNSLATAFAPILTAVAPILTKFIDMLSFAADKLAQFFAVLTGKSTYKKAVSVQEDYSESLNGTAHAAEKAKRSLTGFDEINALSDSSTGASSNNGPAPGDMFEDAQVDSSFADKLGAFFEKIRAMVEPTKKALESLWKSLEPAKDFVWDALKGFYENFLEPVAQWTFGEALPRFFGAIEDGIKKIDWDKLLNSLNGFWKSLEPFAENVGQGLLFLWEEVLVPLGTWAISDVVPVFLDLLSGALDVLNSCIEALKPLFKWLWDTFLKPVAEWTGGVIVSVLKNIADALKKISDWIQEHQGTIQTVVDGFDKIKNGAEKCWGAIKSAFENSGSWFKTAATDPIATNFSNLWNGLKNGAKGAWEGIKSVFSSVTNWFGDIFSAAWQKVKDVFSAGGKVFEGIKDGIANAFKTVVNALIVGINKVVAIPFNAINKMLSSLRSVNIAGITPFSFIHTFTVPQIPKLATGTVVPANYGEFLAVLGDNKREAEVVSPLSTIEQAVRNVMGEGDRGGDWNIIIQRPNGTVEKTFIIPSKARKGRGTEHKTVIPLKA